jgi:hypothetical protein
VTTWQSNTGAKAAYNLHTGNAAAQQTSQNGVKDAQMNQGIALQRVFASVLRRAGKIAPATLSGQPKHRNSVSPEKML